MKGFAPEKIAEIRDRIDIERVIGRSVRLTKKGRRVWGLCPFHHEKSPSFTVDPSKRLYHCFGCHIGGDVFDFVMRIEGIQFRDAARLLAKEAGVDLVEEEESSRDREERQRRERLVSINHAAATFFEHQLQANERARAYLEQERGLSPDSIARFGIGWAPPEWNALTDHLRNKRIDLRGAVSLGLLGTRATDGAPYDRLRGRVIFPIALPGGDLAGFGARRADWIDAEGPKYLNSPESPLYDKSSILYGLKEAKDDIRKSRRAVIVEGYLDVIALHQNGVGEAVAACGTVLTPRHATMLRRQVGDLGEVVTMYDGDAAGQEATRKAAEVLMREGVAVRVAELPETEDPDTFARKVGAEGVTRLIAEAPSAIDFFVAQARRTYKGGGIAGVTKAVEAVKPLLIALQDPLERDVSIDATARLLGIDARLLRKHLDAPRGAPLAADGRSPPAASSAAPAQPATKPLPPPPAVEMALLKLFLESPVEVLAELEAKGALDAFSNPAIQAALEAGIQAHRAGTAFDGPRALDAAGSAGTLDEKSAAALRRTLIEALPERDDVSVCVKRLLRSKNDITLRHLRQQLARETDPEVAERLAKEADRLNRIMASLA